MILLIIKNLTGDWQIEVTTKAWDCIVLEYKTLGGLSRYNSFTIREIIAWHLQGKETWMPQHRQQLTVYLAWERSQLETSEFRDK